MTYTLRLFYDGQKDFQEEEFDAGSPTAAFVFGQNEAKKALASHFNVNLGRIHAETTPTQVSRKK